MNVFQKIVGSIRSFGGQRSAMAKALDYKKTPAGPVGSQVSYRVVLGDEELGTVHKVTLKGKEVWIAIGIDGTRVEESFAMRTKAGEVLIGLPRPQAAKPPPPLVEAAPPPAAEEPPTAPEAPAAPEEPPAAEEPPSAPEEPAAPEPPPAAEPPRVIRAPRILPTTPRPAAARPTSSVPAASAAAPPAPAQPQPQAPAQPQTPTPQGPQALSAPAFRYRLSFGKSGYAHFRPEEWPRLLHEIETHQNGPHCSVCIVEAPGFPWHNNCEITLDLQCRAVDNSPLPEALRPFAGGW